MTDGDRDGFEAGSGDAGLVRAASTEVAVSSVVELASGRRIETEARGEVDLVRIRARDGQCVLTVELTDKGPILRFEAAALELAAPRSLDIACGTLNIQAEGEASISGRSLNLEAKRGSVKVQANDDVRVAGERVMLNSTDPPLALSWDEYLARNAGAGLLPGPDDPKNGDG